MYTVLIMSDTVQNSLKGFSRALTASIFLTGVLGLFFLFWKTIPRPKLSIKNIFILILAIGLISSALAVQLPDNSREASLYGFLVGISIFGVLGLFLISINFWSLFETTVVTIFGSMSTCLASLLLWKIYHSGSY